MSRPTLSYDEALARIQGFQSREGATVLDVCRTALHTHGLKTARAITFLHGFTSCPKQFDQLGQLFFERGENVFIPREPHHGMADRLTTALTQLTAAGMQDLARRVVEVSSGLGDHVTVCGLSMGGTMAAWIAQHFAVDLAVVIAPPLEVQAIPRSIHRIFTDMLLRVPNFFVWWDPRTKANNPNRAFFGYPRYASRALAENFRLARLLQQDAEKNPPAAKRILVITNAADHTVRNSAIYTLATAWQRRAPGRVQTFEFDAALGLLHDLIGPYLKGQKTDVTYPKLLELMAE
jgi:carboxylesterase